MKPRLEMQSTLLALVVGLFLSLNYSKSQDKIPMSAPQLEARHESGFVQEERDPAQPTAMDSLNKSQTPPEARADDLNKSARIYERVVLEGSKIIISCPHLASLDHTFTHTSRLASPSDGVELGWTKQFAPDERLHPYHNHKHHHQHHSHRHSYPHQRPELASHSDSSRRLGVKWFRNHSPLVQELGDNYGDDYSANEQNSYNSTTYGVPLVTHNRVDSLGYVKSLHTVRQTTASFSTTQLPALQNEHNSGSANASPEHSGVQYEFVPTINSPNQERDKVEVSDATGDNQRRLWSISESGELVIDGATPYFSGLYTCRSDIGESSIVLDVLVERNDGVAGRQSGRDRAHKIDAVTGGQTHKKLTLMASTSRNDVRLESNSAPNENEGASDGAKKTLEMQTADVPSDFNSLFDLLDPLKQAAQELQAIDSNSTVASASIATDLNSGFGIHQAPVLNQPQSGSNEEFPLRGDAQPSTNTKNEAKYVIQQKPERVRSKFGKMQTQTTPGGPRLELAGSSNLRYIKRYIHVVKNEAIKTSDLKFIPGFLYNKLQLYCPIRGQRSNLPIHFLVESLCPRHLKQFGKINRRIECQHLARRLITQIVPQSDRHRLMGNCSGSIFDLVWFKNGKRLEFDSEGRVTNTDLNIKKVDPLAGIRASGGEEESSRSLEQLRSSNDESVECSWKSGRVLELEGPREESTGRYMCAYEFNAEKFRKYLTESSNWFSQGNTNVASCCDGKNLSKSNRITPQEKSRPNGDQQWMQVGGGLMKTNETPPSFYYLDSIKNNDSASDTMDNRIFLINSILIDEVSREQALDLVLQLITGAGHQPSPLSMIQTFSLSISERPASFSDLWSTIIQADRAYARRKRADFRRLKRDFTEHLAASSQDTVGSAGVGRGQTEDGLEELSQPFAYDEPAAAARGRQMAGWVQSGGAGSGRMISRSGARPASGLDQHPFAAAAATTTTTSDLTSQQGAPTDSRPGAYMLLNNADGLLDRNIFAAAPAQVRRGRQVGAFMQDRHFNYANEQWPTATARPLATRRVDDERSGFEAGGGGSGCKVAEGASQSTHRTLAGQPPCKVKRLVAPARRRDNPLAGNERAIDFGPDERPTNWAPNQGRPILIGASEGRPEDQRHRHYQHKTRASPIIDDNLAGGAEAGAPEATRVAEPTSSARTTSPTNGRTEAAGAHHSSGAPGRAEAPRLIGEAGGGGGELEALEYEGSVGAGLQEDKLQHSQAVTHRHSASQLNSFSTQSSGSTAAPAACCRPMEAGRRARRHPATIGHSAAPQSGRPGGEMEPLKIDKSNQEPSGYDDTSLRERTLPPGSQEAAQQASSSPPEDVHRKSTPAIGQSVSEYPGAELLDESLMWRASQYLYMHMKAVASSSIFGVEVAVEWSNELTNGSAVASAGHDQASASATDHRQEDETLHRNYLREVPFATIDVIGGQDLQLQCTAQALGRLPEVRWYKRISTLPTPLRGLISLARKIGNDLYWPLTELELLASSLQTTDDPLQRPPKSFICSKSTAIFDNLVNQTFTVVNNLQLSHYNDLLDSDPIKSISLSSILTHNTYACIVDADVRHNYATLGVNFRKTPTNKLQQPLHRQQQQQHRPNQARPSSAGALSISPGQLTDSLSLPAATMEALQAGPSGAGAAREVVVEPSDQDEEALGARFDLFRNNQLMFPIRSWTYLHNNNGSSTGLLDNQLKTAGLPSMAISWTPLMLVLAIVFVLAFVSVLIHLTIRTYRNLTRFSLDEFSEQVASESELLMPVDAADIESLKLKSLNPHYHPQMHMLNTTCRLSVDGSGLRTGCSCEQEQLQHSLTIYSPLYEHYSSQESWQEQVENGTSENIPYSLTGVPGKVNFEPLLDSYNRQLLVSETPSLRCCTGYQETKTELGQQKAYQFNQYQEAPQVNLVENPANLVTDKQFQSHNVITSV